MHESQNAKWAPLQSGILALWTSSDDATTERGGQAAKPAHPKSGGLAV
jgi:hypothetical protein